MCLIARVPKGTKLNEDQINLLEQASYLNPDSWGLMYYHKRAVQVNRGLDTEDGLNALKSAPVETDRIIHFRYATHGDKTVANAHPFRASNWMMMHNGIFQQFSKFKNVSDSKQFAMKVATPIIENYQDDIAKMTKIFDSICGWNNRLAFMGHKGDVVLCGTWFTKMGLALSNTYSFLDDTIPNSLGGLKRRYTPSDALEFIKKDPEMVVSLLANEII